MGVTYGGTVVKQLTVTLKLVKEELPRSKDAPAGLHRCKYRVRCVTADGYTLTEYEAEPFDMALFEEFGNEVTP